MEKHKIVRDAAQNIKFIFTAVNLVFPGMMLYLSFTLRTWILGIIGFVVLAVVAACLANNILSTFSYDDEGFEWRDLMGKKRLEYKDIVSFKLKHGVQTASRSVSYYYVVELMDGSSVQPTIPCSQNNVFFRAFLSTMEEKNPSVHINVPIYQKNVFGEF